MLAQTLSRWGRLLGLGRSSGAVEEDRRVWGRMACDLETTCEPASDPAGGPLPVRARNVSRGGINLLAGRPFEPGSLLSVVLPIGEQGPTQVLACVVRCKPFEAGLWELGCTFAAQLADEDLRLLGARREKAA